MVGLCRFMVSLGQFGSVHGRFESVWVGSWSVWVSLCRFIVGLGRLMISLGQFRSVWVGSWFDLGQFGSVHGRIGSVMVS